MGLLDDAIREHLELKRRRGADTSEVSRQEHEAFGPVRREEIAVDLPGEDEDDGPALFDDEIAETEPAAYEAPAEPEPIAYEPEPAPMPVEPEPEPAAYEPPARSEPPAYEPPPERTLYEERPRAAADPLPPVADEPPAEDPQATVAFSALPEDEQPEVADVVAPDEEPAADELEETPDFLQETPEHDRLWFEQKPPRDFDF